MNNIVILGSTGSIGQNTLKVIDHLGSKFRVMALAAGRNLELLARQVNQFRPDLVSVAREQDVKPLQKLLADHGVPQAPRILWGTDGMVELAGRAEADTVVSATVGAVGLLPTFRALERGKRVALANKESLVIAGELMTRMAHKTGAELLPIDSEHNALHQCLLGTRPDHVKRLILTASGGPFRKLPIEQMKGATPEEALNHPTWRMGRKISIDSATLMNKGLEIIEAMWLFGFRPDQVDIIVHPQSVVHSMVELVDGSILAQLGVTDMQFAIQYALTFPDRLPSALQRLRFSPGLALEFHPPDMERFPCISLAYRAATTSGTMPTVLNAANEVAVDAFLDRKVGFTDIPRIIRTVMDSHAPVAVESIDQLVSTDTWSRQQARHVIKTLNEAS